MLESMLSGVKSNPAAVNTLLLMQADRGLVDLANPARLIGNYRSPAINSIQKKFSNVAFNFTPPQTAFVID